VACVGFLLALGPGCGTVAGIAAFGTSMAPSDDESLQDSRVHLVVDADAGPMVHSTMSYRRSEMGDLDTRKVSFSDGGQRSASVGVRKEYRRDEGVVFFGPVISTTESRFDARMEGEQAGGSGYAYAMGAEIGRQISDSRVRIRARYLAGHGHMDIPVITDRLESEPRRLRTMFSRITADAEYAATSWLAVRAGVSVDKTVLPTDTHLNDNLPIPVRAGPNAFWSLNPFLGIKIQGSFQGRSPWHGMVPAYSSWLRSGDPAAPYPSTSTDTPERRTARSGLAGMGKAGSWAMTWTRLRIRKIKRSRGLSPQAARRWSRSTLGMFAS